MSKRQKTRVCLSSLSPSEREYAERFRAMSSADRTKLFRLLRVLERAQNRGDEFTIKRFCRVPVHLGIDNMLSEMERTPTV